MNEEVCHRISRLTSGQGFQFFALHAQIVLSTKYPKPFSDIFYLPDAELAMIEYELIRKVLSSTRRSCIAFKKHCLTSQLCSKCKKKPRTLVDLSRVVSYVRLDDCHDQISGCTDGSVRAQLYNDTRLATKVNVCQYVTININQNKNPVQHICCTQ